MKVKTLLAAFSIGKNQTIRIRDERRYCTWESCEGCFAFEDYEEGADKVWDYLMELHVSYFECNEYRLLIWAD